jgi:folylpolyglutamate synthase/dihydropteroate synthase
MLCLRQKQTKDWESSLGIIIENSDKIFVTSFFNNQPSHLKKYSANTTEIRQKIADAGSDSMSFTEPPEALKAALEHAASGQPVVIVGSMYMLGELHESLSTTNP